MITVEDILTTGGRHEQRLRWVSPAVRDNATDLATKVSELEARYGKPLEIRSGFRDIDSNWTVGGAPRSRHMTGQAVDLVDEDRKLVKFVTEDLLKELGLWAEAPVNTPTWFHVQTVPPMSGRRFFQP